MDTYRWWCRSWAGTSSRAAPRGWSWRRRRSRSRCTRRRWRCWGSGRPDGARRRRPPRRTSCRRPPPWRSCADPPGTPRTCWSCRSCRRCSRRTPRGRWARRGRPPACPPPLPPRSPPPCPTQHNWISLTASWSPQCFLSLIPYPAASWPRIRGYTVTTFFTSFDPRRKKPVRINRTNTRTLGYLSIYTDLSFPSTEIGVADGREEDLDADLQPLRWLHLHLLDHKGLLGSPEDGGFRHARGRKGIMWEAFMAVGEKQESRKASLTFAGDDFSGSRESICDGAIHGWPTKDERGWMPCFYGGDDVVL